MAATHTTRLNLNMPNEGDFVSVVTDINENMQSIDNAFGMIGSQYDPTATYLKDDYCVHDAKFYRALQDIDTPEAWDATHWTESNIIDEITGTAHSASTLRDIPITIATSDWTLSSGHYVAEFTTAYITTTSKDFVIFDESYKNYAQSDIVAEKKSSGGGMVFTTDVQPTGIITGTIYTVDANDGKVPVLLEDTVTPIANGGTGQSTLAGAKQAFGITSLENDVSTLQNDVTTLNENITNLNKYAISTQTQRTNVKLQNTVGSSTYTVTVTGLYIAQVMGTKAQFDVNDITILYNGTNESGRQTALLPLAAGSICKLSCADSSTESALYQLS